MSSKLIVLARTWSRFRYEGFEDELLKGQNSWKSGTRTVEGLFAIGLFGKKPQNPHEEIHQPVMNRLQELTGTDAEMYQSLSRTLFLEPKRIGITLETVLSQASEFESKGDRIRAEVWYRIAGGISLSRADVAGVRKYFDKAASIAGDSRPEYKVLSRRAEDAVDLAGKFYGNM